MSHHVQGTHSRPLVFHPHCWNQLNWLCRRANTEIGCFGVADHADYPFFITRLFFVKQKADPCYIEFDDAALADYQEDRLDEGLHPYQYLRIWCHTHPGNSATPSSTDWNTLDRVFGNSSFGVMFILARGGDVTCHLQTNTKVVTTDPFTGAESTVNQRATHTMDVRIAHSMQKPEHTAQSSAADWEAIYQANINPGLDKPPFRLPDNPLDDSCYEPPPPPTGHSLGSPITNPPPRHWPLGKARRKYGTDSNLVDTPFDSTSGSEGKQGLGKSRSAANDERDADERNPNVPTGDVFGHCPRRGDSNTTTFSHEYGGSDWGSDWGSESFFIEYSFWPNRLINWACLPIYDSDVERDDELREHLESILPISYTVKRFCNLNKNEQRTLLFEYERENKTIAQMREDHASSLWDHHHQGHQGHLP